MATLVLGGALQTLYQAFIDHTSGNTIWVQSATFALTGELRARLPGNTCTIFTKVIGYGTTRGDNGQPTLKSVSAGASGILSVASDYWHIRNFILDGNGIASSGLILNSSHVLVSNVKITSTRKFGVLLGPLSDSTKMIKCLTQSCSGASNEGSFHFMGGTTLLDRCVAISNVQSGFALGSGTLHPKMIQCFSAANRYDGIHIQDANLPDLLHCDIVFNERYGVWADGSGASWHGIIMNNIFADNQNLAMDGNTISFDSEFGRRAERNAYYRNNNSTSGTQQTLANGELKAVFMALTPFTSAASGSSSVNGDYSLNDTATGGALCRKTGEPGEFPGIPRTVGDADIGAVQTT